MAAIVRTVVLWAKLVKCRTFGKAQSHVFRDPPRTRRNTVQHIYPRPPRRTRRIKPRKTSTRSRLSSSDLSPARLEVGRLSVYSLGPWREDKNSLRYTKLGQAIHDYKYGRLLQLESNLLLELLAENLHKSIVRTWSKSYFSVCVSVPSNRDSGRDLARDVATKLASSLEGLKYAPDMIFTTKNVPPVKSVPRGQRIQYVRGVFGADASQIAPDDKLLVIDDILDSGATLREVDFVLQGSLTALSKPTKPTYVSLSYVGRPLR